MAGLIDLTADTHLVPVHAECLDLTIDSDDSDDKISGQHPTLGPELAVTHHTVHRQGRKTVVRGQSGASALPAAQRKPAPSQAKIAGTGRQGDMDREKRKPNLGHRQHQPAVLQPLQQLADRELEKQEATSSHGPFHRTSGLRCCSHRISHVHYNNRAPCSMLYHCLVAKHVMHSLVSSLTIKHMLYKDHPGSHVWYNSMLAGAPDFACLQIDLPCASATDSQLTSTDCFIYRSDTVTPGSS